MLAAIFEYIYIYIHTVGIKLSPLPPLAIFFGKKGLLETICFVLSIDQRLEQVEMHGKILTEGQKKPP